MTIPADSVWSNSVAIIGMSGRFPGARDLAEFWNNLQNGVESINSFSPEELQRAGVSSRHLQNPDYVNAGGVLNDIESFDAAFFRLNAREAETLDPQQRLLLECAWHALEDAGYNPEASNVPVGVFAGCALSTYLFNLLSHPEFRGLVGDFQVFTGNDKDFLTTRISYKLNLKGPSLAVQSACSTSLVAVCLACDSLLNHQCDMALAGGVAIRVPQTAGYVWQEGQIFSRDGHTRAFDAAATGTVFTNGVGMVLLKRLPEAIADGDCIRAVIRGFAVNNDGSLKVGYTAPSLDAQAEVVATALAVAEVSPSSVSYVEAHGTATPLGDPIEIAALSKAYQTASPQPKSCAVGSVKSNVGHLDTASGVAALIKTVLALEHRTIPPSINFATPNPRIDFSNSPFYVNTQSSAWDGPLPRRAGVHSFGIGGTNAHVVLEEAPAANPVPSQRNRQLLIWSARSRPALQAATTQLAAYFQQNAGTPIADAAYTLYAGRKEFAQRGMLVCSSASDATAALNALDARRMITGTVPANDTSVAFMFPGQGSQCASMGLALYHSEPTFRKIVDECSRMLQSQLGFELRDILYPAAAQSQNATVRLQRTGIGELALFVVEYALAQLWMDWGVRPQCMIGQSIGEYVAACIAGVFSLSDILFVLARRCQLLETLPAGGMLLVQISERELAGLLNPELDLAAINSASGCVISGPIPAIEHFEETVRRKGFECKRLAIAHGLHSRMMQPIVPELAAAFSQITLRAPQVPFVSSVTGTWISAASASDPTYWANHILRTVRFSDAVASSLSVSNRTLLEVGPGQVLTALALRHSARPEDRVVLSSMPAMGSLATEEETLLHALGRLWLQGIKVDWKAFWQHERRRRVPLPTYPFERKRYWVDRQMEAAALDISSRATAALAIERCAPAAQNCGAGADEIDAAYAAPTDEVERKIAEIWQALLGVEKVGIYDSFFSLGGHSMQGAQLLAMLRSTFRVAIPLPTLFEVPTVAGMAERVRALQ